MSFDQVDVEEELSSEKRLKNVSERDYAGRDMYQRTFLKR